MLFAMVANGLAKAQIGITTAKAARPVARRQRHCLIEKEHGRPGVRPVKRMTPVLVFETTGDPQVSLMVTDKTTGVVHQAPAIAGQESATRIGV
jgi:hypothetical protein